MSPDQIFLFLLLVTVFVLLVWGRVRYDVVAFAALIVALLFTAVGCGGDDEDKVDPTTGDTVSEGIIARVQGLAR